MIKKKILIVCVNYNSYDDLKTYLNSIDHSFGIISNLCDIDVYVADNSSSKQEIDVSVFESIKPIIISLDNLGYLGGATFIINNIVDVNIYDFVIISNVDIIFEKDTLHSLLQLKVLNNVAWISPYRYSLKYDMPLFVERKKRISKIKLRTFIFIYKYPFLKKIQSYFTIKRYKNRKNKIEKQYVYSGCGSCIILTSNFFRHYTQINYPIFLYGEEIYLAELLYKKKLNVLYEPSVRIKNLGGVSTSSINEKKFCNYNYKAMKYIYKTFFES